MMMMMMMMCVCVCVCVLVCLSVPSCVCVCVRESVHACAALYIYIYIYIESTGTEITLYKSVKFVQSTFSGIEISHAVINTFIHVLPLRKFHVNLVICCVVHIINKKFRFLQLLLKTLSIDRREPILLWKRFYRK